MEENQKLKESTIIKNTEETELDPLGNQNENCIIPTPTVDRESDSATAINRRSESDGDSV